MGKQLFGTDGIRGVAGEYPLDPVTVHAFGMALGSTARHLSADPEIVIGMDTRESGPWLAEQVAGGLAERGVRARLAGERFDLLFVVAGVTNDIRETISRVTTEEFVRVMMTNALGPLRAVGRRP